MPDLTARLDLPLIKPSQAQKHVTHNEALQLLDGLVQAVLEEAGAQTPPFEPVTGQLFALGANPSGDWTGEAGKLALRTEGAWIFITPQAGWRAWDKATGRHVVYDDVNGWVEILHDHNNLPGVGINATADATNRLAVASAATLLSHEGAGHQLKINKAADTDTASLLFQSNWTGHAELGLAGDTAFSIKVSDGTSWFDAIRADAAAQQVTLSMPVVGAAVQSAPEDDTPGRLLTVGAGGLLGQSSPKLTTSIDDFDIPSGTYHVDGTTVPGTVPPITTVSDTLVVTHSSANQTTQYYYLPNDNRTYVRKSIGSLSWGAWRMVYDQKYAVGTVSMSGGVPTGALFEPGANANGGYVRFADGTQICWHALTSSDTSAVTWTYPAAFLTTPKVAASPGGGASIQLTWQARGTTSVDWNAFDLSGARVSVTIDMMAIGRWS